MSRAYLKSLLKTFLILFAFIFVAVIVYGLVYIVNEYTAPKIYEKEISQYCFEYGVDANLVYATIKAESNFKERAKSSKGAIGLMQIMPQTAHYISLLIGDNPEEIDLYDPLTNIKYGIYYLGYLSRQFEDLDLIILAYNAGEGNVKLWKNKYYENGELIHIPFKESEAYLKKVKKYIELYKRKYNY